ncbi:MAG: hypothetical protein IKG18_11045 [Atopobiaceae bacterium]|nr:hypothetical protein [Atopobiaceae bacterium]
MDDKEYRKLLGEKRASRLNVIIAAVNRRTPKDELDIDEVESRFYDELEEGARQLEEKYGERPVYEMDEIEWDDPVLDIYGDEDPGEWYRRGAAPKDERKMVMVPDWVKDEPDKYIPVFTSLLFEWSLFGVPKGQTAREALAAGRDGWTDEDTEYVYRRLVEEGIVVADEPDAKYVLAIHGWPAERECTVLRRVRGEAPQRFDYSRDSWVEDYDRWYAYVVDTNYNEPISKAMAWAIIESHGGKADG